MPDVFGHRAGHVGRAPLQNLEQCLKAVPRLSSRASRLVPGHRLTGWPAPFQPAIRRRERGRTLIGQLQRRMASAMHRARRDLSAG
jgi:hypothetical protein